MLIPGIQVIQAIQVIKIAWIYYFGAESQKNSTETTHI